MSSVISSAIFTKVRQNSHKLIAIALKERLVNKKYGFFRVSAAVPKVTVGDPMANATEMLSMLQGMADSDLVVFPELSLSAYTCGDLFHHRTLLDQCLDQIDRIATNAPNRRQLILIGAPLALDGALYNCVVAINDGRVIGVVPKQFVPNYKEFYEDRWFAAGEDGLPGSIDLKSQSAPFGTRLLFTCKLDDSHAEAVIHAEVCEAIWMPIPPSSLGAIAGANILCNLSASNETIGKAEYRRNLVTGQSGRCMAGYVYTSSGPTESTSDIVFGGHAIISESGHSLAESSRVGDNNQTRRDSYFITSDIDVERLDTERRMTTTFADTRRILDEAEYTRVPFLADNNNQELLRKIEAMPFVPKANQHLTNRCSEVFGIQTAALAKRLELLGSTPTLSIGISGGLDSTLALLVACKTCDLLNLPRSVIRAVTMPGYGTTDKTLDNARKLMSYLGVTALEIDIREATLLEYKELSEATGYEPFGQVVLSKDMSVDEFTKRIMAVPQGDRHDLIFENVQARRRTELLMNMGFVLGTGDMSELWLGWCTYNADQQSMYNVNCSVPKTLVRFLVEYVANTEFESPITDTLLSIAKTEITPELLPPDEHGNIAQSTEETVGPYELHDFFLFNLVRYGFSPSKVYFLAKQAKGFSKDYDDKTIKHWLSVNIKRAFAQQYKRDNVPNGPKVGSVSLSPRGDWRMPSDASCEAWLRDLQGVD